MSSFMTGVTGVTGTDNMYCNDKCFRTNQLAIAPLDNCPLSRLALKSVYLEDEATAVETCHLSAREPDNVR